MRNPNKEPFRAYMDDEEFKRGYLSGRHPMKSTRSEDKMLVKVGGLTSHTGLPSYQDELEDVRNKGKAAENVGINIRINSYAMTCNILQMQFISQPGDGIAATAATLARQWNTSQKTAERDIRQLRYIGLIAQQVARRNRCYIYQQQP